MKARGAAVQGALALLGLVSVYATWQRDKEVGTGGEVVAVSGSLSDLQKVRYDDGKTWIELEKAPGDDSVWLHLGPKTEPKTPERRVRGTDGALALYKRFVPLMAARSLGVLKPDKLKELGFDKTKRRLELSLRTEKRTFQVALSPLGAGDPYLKDERDSHVYVVPNTMLTDLDAASVRLVDRRLHKLMTDEFDGVKLIAKGKVREFVRLPGESPLVIRLAAKQTPQKPDDQVKAWHDRAWHVVPLDVLGKGETPDGGDPEVQVRIEYTFRGRTVGWAELAQISRAPAAVSTEAPPSTEVYVRTEHTASWIRVSGGAESLISEGVKLAGG